MHSKNHGTYEESGVGVGHSKYFSDTLKIDRNLIKRVAHLYMLILKKTCTNTAKKYGTFSEKA